MAERSLPPQFSLARLLAAVAWVGVGLWTAGFLPGGGRLPLLHIFYWGAVLGAAVGATLLLPVLVGAAMVAGCIALLILPTGLLLYGLVRLLRIYASERQARKVRRHLATLFDV